MKVIHWSPEKNKSEILENGIKISDVWVSGSILTPFKNLNRWWLDFLLHDEDYLGFVFELDESDFPLVHSHWCIDTYTEQDEDLEVVYKRRYHLNEIQKNNPRDVFVDIESLKYDYKNTILWRIAHGEDVNLDVDEPDDKIRIHTALKFIQNNPKKAIKAYFDNPDFMEFVFEDYEVLFFKDIKPERIKKVIKPNTNYSYTELMEEIKKELKLD